MRLSRPRPLATNRNRSRGSSSKNFHSFFASATAKWVAPGRERASTSGTYFLVVYEPKCWRIPTNWLTRSPITPVSTPDVRNPQGLCCGNGIIDLLDTIARLASATAYAPPSRGEGRALCRRVTKKCEHSRRFWQYPILGSGEDQSQ